MTPARLKWYFARLAAMSPPEVLHRLREAARKRAWKTDRRGWDAFAGLGDAPLPGLDILRARLARATSTSLPSGDVQALGQSYDVGQAGVWFRDPVRGAAWPGPESYCFDVDVRSTGHERGDVKFVWEINRLQFLHGLAGEVAATGNAAARARIFTVLNGWCAANPPFRGVNWFSGIELAMRLVTLTLVVAAAGPTLTVDERALLRRMIAAHGFWLHRYPSKFSSANNHLLAEGLGLLLAGVLVPDLPQAAEWLTEGRHILETEAALQITADGVGGEQSPTYQAFSMEMLAFGALVCDSLDAPLAPVVKHRLRSGAIFLRALMDDAGRCPRIGDDDQGYVLAENPAFEPRYPASIVAAVAGLLDDPALLPPGHDPHLRDALFATPLGRAEAGTGVLAFTDGGYTVLRQPMASRLAVVTFDHGPLGYLSLAAHGHADALAIWLSLDDQPVFVDAGTFLYHSGGALRNLMRSSAAHNTLTIGGASQSLPSSAFSWSGKARAELVAGEDGADWQIAAHHDGYLKRFGVRHRRAIGLRADGFDIADRLEEAAAPLAAEIGFLLAPGLDAVVTSAGIRISRGDAPLLVLTPPEGMTATLKRGERATGRGLYSPAFGALEDTTQIVLSGPVGRANSVTRIRIVAPTLG